MLVMFGVYCLFLDVLFSLLSVCFDCCFGDCDSLFVGCCVDVVLFAGE